VNINLCLTAADSKNKRITAAASRFHILNFRTWSKHADNDVKGLATLLAGEMGKKEHAVFYTVLPKQTSVTTSISNCTNIKRIDITHCALKKYKIWKIHTAFICLFYAQIHFIRRKWKRAVRIKICMTASFAMSALPFPWGKTFGVWRWASTHLSLMRGALPLYTLFVFMAVFLGAGRRYRFYLAVVYICVSATNGFEHSFPLRFFERYSGRVRSS
jgi:hypothetical protein